MSGAIQCIGQAPAWPTTCRISDQKQALIKQVALRSLAELVICLSLGAVVSLFVAPVMVGYLFSCILLQCLIALAIRTIEAVMTYSKTMTSERAFVFSMLRTGTFSYITGKHVQDLVHETGHALAISAVCKNAHPQIKIIPFQGGLTSYSTGKLSWLGHKIGAAGSLIFVVGAGAGLTLLVSSILLFLSQKLQNTHKELSAYLFSYSFNDFWTHAHYALSATWTSPTNHTHDFVHLSSLTGISPIVMLIAIVAIPLLIWIGTARYRQPVTTSAEIAAPSGSARRASLLFHT